MTQTVQLVIDPSSPELWTSKQEDLNALCKYLDGTSASCVWDSSTPYEWSYKRTKYTFSFTKPVIKRTHDLQSNTCRYDVINSDSAPLGRGGYGVVYPVLTSFSFKAGKPNFYNDHDRVVKIEDHTIKDRRGHVTNEYRCLSKANHLNIKPPVFFGNFSYLIMDRAKGISLEDILHPTKRLNLIPLIPPLTMAKRLELSLAILSAIKDQVSDKNLIHRDIKPGNIICDLSANPVVVNIIDFGFAITRDDQDKRRLGTLPYRAPESFENKPKYTAKTDVYSAGRVLSYLWGDDFKNYYVHPEKDKIYDRSKVLNNRLFSAPEIFLFMDKEDQNIIRSILNNMLEIYDSNRCSLDEVIQQFSQLKLNKYSTKITEQPGDERYKHDFIEKVNNILVQIELLKKEQELFKSKGLKYESDVLGALLDKIQLSTEYVKKNANSTIVLKYQQFCALEIENAKPILNHHRDAWWLLAEIATAIALLGVGYLIAVGVTYHSTGRMGLFSQTQTARIAEILEANVMDLPSL